MSAKKHGPDSALQPMAMWLASNCLVHCRFSVWSDNKLKNQSELVGLCWHILIVSSILCTDVSCCLSFSVYFWSVKSAKNYIQPHFRHCIVYHFHTKGLSIMNIGGLAPYICTRRQRSIAIWSNSSITNNLIYYFNNLLSCTTYFGQPGKLQVTQNTYTMLWRKSIT